MGAQAAEGSTPKSKEAEEKRVDKDCYPLVPHERKVAAALLVVLRTATKKGVGLDLDRKTILHNNNPATGSFLQLLSDRSVSFPACSSRSN